MRKWRALNREKAIRQGRKDEAKRVVRLPQGSVARRRIKENNRREYHNRQAYLVTTKLERGCALCGFKGHPAALDFDHLDRSAKLVALSKSLSLSRAAFFAEVKKCRVLCANCHRIETANQNDRANVSEAPTLPLFEIG